MDLHRLNVFVTAAQYLSFTEAAKQLHIAQPSVSHDIAELEKELGAKLFLRTKAGIALTPAGAVFISEAYKMISIAQGARQKIEKLAAAESGELRIGFVSEQMAEPIAPFLKRFHEGHPTVSMTFNSYTSIAVSRRIQSNEVDLGLGRRESLVRHEDVDWMHLYEDPFYLAVPEGHRLAGAGAATLEAVKDETILIMSAEANPGFYELVQRLCLTHGHTPLLNATSNDRIATIMMARIGMGIALLTKQFLGVYNFPDIKLIPLAEKDAFHDVGVAWNKRAANPLVEPFLKELQDCLLAFPITI
ncbi:MAG: LysR family transcriptional regulator [Clostridiales Family XIII bacterium]|jgi:DNA-binding transcriptional LysR family regulator|nr:LysR family transcriptional regulator [Clostridiales Family XIII bacterium]